MSAPIVYEYATEGAPLLVADLRGAAAWRGTDDDGQGVTVEYMGAGVDKLPAALAGKKPGRQARKFASLDEARAFQAEVIDGLRRLNPAAARLPRYPDQPAYYVEGKRAFSVELHYTSAYDSVLAAMRTDAQLVTIDKKARVDALFVQQQGGGRGLVVADPAQRVLAVAKLHEARPVEALAAPLLGLRRPKAQGSLKVDGRILVFDSALSAAQLARKNWKQDSLLDAAAPAFERSASGPLHVPDQRLPCAAFVRLEAGAYNFSYRPEVKVGGAVASVLWLSAK